MGEREDVGLAGLEMAELRSESVGFERDLKRDAIGKESREHREQ